MYYFAIRKCPHPVVIEVTDDTMLKEHNRVFSTASHWAFPENEKEKALKWAGVRAAISGRADANYPFYDKASNTWVNPMTGKPAAEPKPVTTEIPDPITAAAPPPMPPQTPPSPPLAPTPAPAKVPTPPPVPKPAPAPVQAPEQPPVPTPPPVQTPPPAPAPAPTPEPYVSPEPVAPPPPPPAPVPPPVFQPAPPPQPVQQVEPVYVPEAPPAAVYNPPIAESAPVQSPAPAYPPISYQKPVEPPPAAPASHTNKQKEVTQMPASVPPAADPQIIVPMARETNSLFLTMDTLRSQGYAFVEIKTALGDTFYAVLDDILYWSSNLIPSMFTPVYGSCDFRVRGTFTEKHNWNDTSDVEKIMSGSDGLELSNIVISSHRNLIRDTDGYGLLKVLPRVNRACIGDYVYFDLLFKSIKRTVDKDTAHAAFGKAEALAYEGKDEIYDHVINSMQVVSVVPFFIHEEVQDPNIINDYYKMFPKT